MVFDWVRICSLNAVSTQSTAVRKAVKATNVKRRSLEAFLDKGRGVLLASVAWVWGVTHIQPPVLT